MRNWNTVVGKEQKCSVVGKFRKKIYKGEIHINFCKKNQLLEKTLFQTTQN